MTIEPLAASALSRARHHTDRRVVETGKRLVEQHQPWIVQQRALEREALPHAARKSVHRVVGAIREPGTLERSVDDAGRIQTVQLREELQILARREFRIKVQLVREQADSPPQRRAEVARRRVAEPDVAGGGRGERGQDADQRGLAGAVRPEQAEDVAGARGQRDVRERAAPAVVSRNIVQSNGIEVGVGHAQGAPSAPSGAAIPGRSGCGAAASRASRPL